jgi:predicted transcriptional regulator
MKSYLDTIKEHAASRNVDVKEAFRVADLPTSTYYRTINNTTELRYETALKIFNAVDEKLKRDKHRERNKSINVNRKRVYRY